MEKKERTKTELQAIENYPTGTKFYSVGDFTGKIYEVMSNSKFYWNPDHKNCLTSSDKGCIFLKGKWAKKIE